MSSHEREYRLTLADFDYALPTELIAQAPSAERASSRLLHVARDTLTDLQFRDLPQLISPADLIVLNDTRVIRARLIGRKRSGGRVEALVERIEGRNQAWLQIRASH